MTKITGPAPARVPWNDLAAVDELVKRHGAEVRFHDGELRITAPSPEAYLEAIWQAHPMSAAARPLLERADIYREVRTQALDALRNGNEDPQAFLATSPYRVIEIWR